MIHALLQLGGHEASLKAQDRLSQMPKLSQRHGRNCPCFTHNKINHRSPNKCWESSSHPISRISRAQFGFPPGTGKLPCPPSRLPWQLPRCRSAAWRPWGFVKLCGGVAARGTGAAAGCGTLPCSDHGVDAERSLGLVGDSDGWWFQAYVYLDFRCASWSVVMFEMIQNGWSARTRSFSRLVEGTVLVGWNLKPLNLSKFKQTWAHDLEPKML